MPTFQSIPLHPQFLERLNAGGETTTSIRTPQALLSRTPKALQDLLFDNNNNDDNDNDNDNNNNGKATMVVDRLRKQVAQAMISKTKTGKVRRQQQQQQQQQQQSPPPLIPGVTVRPSPPLFFWSTGCPALDDLISFPSSSYYNPKQHNQPPTSSSCGSGSHLRLRLPLPSDIVLHLVGSYGKTPLALSIAKEYHAQLLGSMTRTPSSSSGSSAVVVRYCYSTAGHAGLPQSVRRSPTTTTTTSTTTIEFQPIANRTQLVRILGALEEEWGGGSKDNNNNGPDMLIIDSLSNLEDNNIDNDNHLMDSVRWKRLARLYQIPIIVVTNTTATTPTPTANNTAAAAAAESPTTNDYYGCRGCDIVLECTKAAMTATKDSTTTNGNHNNHNNDNDPTATTIAVRRIQHPARISSNDDPDVITVIHTPLGGLASLASSSSSAATAAAAAAFVEG